MTAPSIPDQHQAAAAANERPLLLLLLLLLPLPEIAALQLMT